MCGLLPVQVQAVSTRIELNELKMMDPMDLVAESDLGDMECADDGLGESQSRQTEEKVYGNVPVGKGYKALCDIGGGVTLTPAGIRLALCRSKRPCPLLKLMCVGCGESTHSPDLFVPGDTMECLVQTQHF